MPFRNLTVLAVVPARGGSKGIPRKNLRNLAGQSLIERVANLISAVPEIDRAVLSTDDKEIAEEGLRVGLDVPFTRPAELAADDSKSIDTWHHAWLASEKHYGTRFELSLLLEPTSPLREPEDISKTLELLAENRADSVVTISRTPAHFTPEKTLKLSQLGTIVPYLKDGLEYSLRQGIPNYYHRNGICYCVTRTHLIDHHHIMEGRCIPYVTERPVVNIDEELDFIWAEFLLRKK